MTQWHLDWQGKWPEHQREFVIGEHRADICTVPCASLVSTMAGLSSEEPLVVEFQHSYLDAGAISEREDYYEAAAGQMIWVWDARKAATEGRLFVDHYNPKIFTWKHFRASMTACQFPVFLDVGSSLLFVRQWPRKEWIDEDNYDFGGSGGRWGWGDGVCQPLSTKEFVRALTMSAE